MIEICIEKRAEKGIRKLPKETAKRIISKIKELQGNPRPAGSRKIVGSICDYRLRIGDYRVVYELDEKNERVIVMAVGHRKDVYRNP
jgi:mRNA interferase RelE/StbE